MPVGNSDRGVGLGAGEVMVFADLNYQNFNWWHEQISDAYVPDTDIEEGFDHLGQFNNRSLNLGFTIGLNDYWNITVSQLVSERCMDWEGPVWESVNDDGFDPNYHQIGDSKTVHHRTECSSTDFINESNINESNTIAFGGFLGDTRINFKYLLYNQGKGPGSRVFLGGGLLIPSSATLTESPWTKIDYDHDHNPSTKDKYTYTPHRHFYLSDGAYKMFTEIQFFKKRIKKPVFWGGTFAVTFPLNESDYGFKPSTNYELSFIALSGPLKEVKSNAPFMLSSIGLNFTVAYSGPSEWNGVRTPNSEAILYIPGISFLFGSKAGTFGINIQKGYEDYLQKSPTDIEETNEIYAISLSYRRVLDKVLDKLYWK